MTIKKTKIISINDKKIWIESDILGNKHIMIQHQDCESEPFTYCTFYYDHRYTCNSMIREQAEKMALALGAIHPVEYINRGFL